MKKPRKAKPWTKAEKKKMTWALSGDSLPSGLSVGPSYSINLAPKSKRDKAMAKWAIETGVLPAGLFFTEDGLLHSKGKKLTAVQVKAMEGTTLTISVTAK